MPQPEQRFPHAMLREIFEQPATLRATLARYVEAGAFRAAPCEPVRAWLRAAAGEIVIAASGSSRHAALAAELLIEDASGIPVDVEYASEYPYRSERAHRQAGVMVVSQSGETADTLLALRKAGRAGLPTLAITNVPGSSMDIEAAASFPTEAGRELAIPATKSFSAQLLNLYLLSLLAAEQTGTMDAEDVQQALARAAEVPALIAHYLDTWNTQAEALAARLIATNSMLFLGRGVHYPIAREGALKLKESAYLHAEGYPSGELKHGPNALVGEDTHLLLLATHDPEDAGSLERYGRTRALLEELVARRTELVVLANAGDTSVPRGPSTTVIEVPVTTEPLLTLCEVVPLQLFAYHMAIARGIDVDRPRNLTKAVLAE